MNRDYDRLIFELGCPGREGFALPDWEEPGCELPQKLLRDTACGLPQVSETDVVRHYTRLSQKNYGVDEGFYPLGSCTMKYNPKINEEVAALDGFTAMHPLQPVETAQGTLEVLYRLGQMLAEFAGLDSVTLQPAAGAHGEVTGLMIMRAYHLSRGDSKRTKVIIPDSAHGTNPASTAQAGLEVVEVKSDADGNVDIDALRALMSDEVAGLMLTNPNTLGLFEKNILQIAGIVHEAGGLLYYDGANANAVAGVCRPGDMGYDIAHLNLHKTFSTPHGGGGPGSGPVAVSRELAVFLPKPVLAFKDGKYVLDDDRPLSIGRVRSFYGNVGVMLRAYAYLRTLGAEGLRNVAQAAVLNANYLRVRLRGQYALPYDRACMHEAVFAGLRDQSSGVTTGHIAKRLIDYGYHPPTVYFPLIVKEAMMVEPTETESKETLDAFADALISIAQEAQSEPEKVMGAPHTTALSHLDETRAARNPVLTYAQMRGM